MKSFSSSIATRHLFEFWLVARLSFIRRRAVSKPLFGVADCYVSVTIACHSGDKILSLWVCCQTEISASRHGAAQTEISGPEAWRSSLAGAPGASRKIGLRPLFGWTVNPACKLSEQNLGLKTLTIWPDNNTGYVTLTVIESHYYFIFIFIIISCKQKQEISSNYSYTWRKHENQYSNKSVWKRNTGGNCQILLLNSLYLF